MPGVSNTSPLSNLAIIGRLSLLKSQCSELWIPPAVSRELENHPNPEALAAVQQAIHEQWIRIAAPTASPLLNLLLVHLHAGEAEAIALAAEINAETIFIDEQEGRAFAAQAGLCVTGVLGILSRAKQTALIPALKPEIRLLREKARFFVAASLEAKVLAAVGESMY